MGCPIIVSDEFEIFKTKNLDVQVCKPLIEADSMLVLTHVKGHACSGMGGSIKNLGMGCVFSKTKKEIHTLSQPKLTGSCVNCNICLAACPFSAITKGSEHPKFNLNGCFGCDACIEVCPENALEPKIASFDKLLAEAAFAVVKKVKKIHYINAIINISRFCDCVTENGPILLPDIGYLASNDIVEIDRKSIYLVNQKAGKDIFKENHNKDPYAQVNEMEILLKK